jgi:hypothetical protein
VYIICLLWNDYNLIDLFSITSFIIKSFSCSFCVLFFIAFLHLVMIKFFYIPQSKMIIIYVRLFLWPIHFPKYCFTSLMMPVMIVVKFQSFVTLFVLKTHDYLTLIGIFIIWYNICSVKLSCSNISYFALKHRNRHLTDKTVIFYWKKSDCSGSLNFEKFDIISTFDSKPFESLIFSKIIQKNENFICKILPFRIIKSAKY